MAKGKVEQGVNQVHVYPHLMKEPMVQLTKPEQNATTAYNSVKIKLFQREKSNHMYVSTCIITLLNYFSFVDRILLELTLHEQ